MPNDGHHQMYTRALWVATVYACVISDTMKTGSLFMLAETSPPLKPKQNMTFCLLDSVHKGFLQLRTDCKQKKKWKAGKEEIKDRTGTDDLYTTKIQVTILESINKKLDVLGKTTPRGKRLKTHDPFRSFFFQSAHLRQESEETRIFLRLVSVLKISTFF